MDGEGFNKKKEENYKICSTPLQKVTLSNYFFSSCNCFLQKVNKSQYYRNMEAYF